MKKTKKILALLTVLVLCLAPFLATPIQANASTPTTYHVKYVPALNELRVQKNLWQDGQEHWALHVMTSEIKDGDILVVDNTGGLGADISVDVRLSNLTVGSDTLVLISAKSIDNYYGIKNSSASVSGNVTNAYVYDNSVANFNSSVGTLNVLSENQEILSSTVAIAGTCDHLIASGKSYKHYEFYNFKTNTLRITNGTLTTIADNYSKTPSATPSLPATNSGEYDDVPKTGDALVNPLWLIMLSAIFFTGSIVVKKMK